MERAAAEGGDEEGQASARSASSGCAASCRRTRTTSTCASASASLVVSLSSSRPQWEHNLLSHMSLSSVRIASDQNHLQGWSRYLEGRAKCFGD